MPRILLIDDDPAIREITRRILERAGYDVLEAADGEAGIRQMRTQPVDLVLTDIYMPGEDGLSTIRRLRREWPDVKIITISGGSGAGLGDLNAVASAMGALRTLGKPFGQGELLEAVQSVVGPAAVKHAE